MKRHQLEHVLRAASRIVEQRDFLVMGSAAILGAYGDEVLPIEASRSEEADLAPFDDPTGEKSAAVEGSLTHAETRRRPHGPPLPRCLAELLVAALEARPVRQVDHTAGQVSRLAVDLLEADDEHRAV